MITGLDHVIALVPDIRAARAAYEQLLARAPAWQANDDGADRVLFTLENVSLELMAPSGPGATADRIRALLAEGGEGLASLCFRTNDIDRLQRRLDRVALQPEQVVAVESRDLISGATLCWRRTRAASGRTHGVRLFFLELAAERPRSTAAGEAPVTGLDHVVISTDNPERAAALYGARLGLDMALDRSHPEWGRLMFFRCGDLIIEVVHRPAVPEGSGEDRLWGLSWRVEDIDAARARLIAAGIEVSEVRSGRKPGTRVMTVRGSTCGIRTILLERSPAP